MPHGIRVSCECDTMGLPVCYGSASEVFAASSSFTHFYTLRFKKKRKERQWWQAQLYTDREVYCGPSLLAELNFQSVSGLYENFSGMTPSEFEFLIYWIWEKISKKDTAFRKTISVQERLARTLLFFGKCWFVSAVSVQDFQARNQLHRSASVWSSFWKIEGFHADKSNIIICGLWKKFKIRF